MVIRDTVDVREMTRNRLQPVVAGEFGRVLRTEGRYVVVALAPPDGETSRAVLVDRRDVERR